ncbi:MAG TPA: hypothetical protein VJI75_01985 [Candidatus Nanoarchaeia archaeon]|nr:hypothetical protein [Candidatus Nanoarchaeia archaeon]
MIQLRKQLLYDRIKSKSLADKVWKILHYEHMSIQFDRYDAKKVIESGNRFIFLEGPARFFKAVKDQNFKMLKDIGTPTGAIILVDGDIPIDSVSLLDAEFTSLFGERYSAITFGMRDKGSEKTPKIRLLLAFDPRKDSNTGRIIEKTAVMD